MTKRSHGSDGIGRDEEDNTSSDERTSDCSLPEDVAPRLCANRNRCDKTAAFEKMLEAHRHEYRLGCYKNFHTQEDGCDMGYLVLPLNLEQSLKIPEVLLELAFERLDTEQ